MRTIEREDPSAPPRLVDGGDAAAERLRGFVQRSIAGEGEPEAWRRLQRRAEAPERNAFMLVALGAVIGAGLCLLMVFVQLNRAALRVPATAMVPPAPELQPAPAPGARVEPAPAPPAPMGAVRLGALPRALPAAAPIEILGHARVTLSADGTATAREEDGEARVELAAGSVEVRAPEAAHARTRVVAGGYTFVDVGTTYAVAMRPGVTELRVTQGLVEVWQGVRRLGVIAGPAGFWTSSARSEAAPEEPAPRRTSAPHPRAEAPAPQPTEAPPPAPAPGAVTPAAPALALPAPRPTASSPAAPAHAAACPPLGGATDVGAAVACRQQQARGSGLGAQTALYELGRLERERGALPAALAALEAYRARFPRGSLRLEVDLSLVELLPRLGRHQEALGESARLLAQHPELERADELHVLRGNIYREALHDCAAAQREYGAVTAAGGAGDDALFFRAACLETLRRPGEAAELYRAYLRRPHPTRAAEARRRLDLLP